MTFILAFYTFFSTNMPKRHRQPESIDSLSDDEGYVRTENADSLFHESKNKNGSSKISLKESSTSKKSDGSSASSVSFTKHSSSKEMSIKQKEKKNGENNHLGLEAFTKPSSPSLPSCDSQEVHTELSVSEADDEEVLEEMESSDSVSFSNEEEEDYDSSDETDEMSEENDEEDSRERSTADEEDDDLKNGNITVNFEVYDMEKRHIDAVAHLIDQLCPDSRNEVDRSSFAEALMESPYTSIVKLGEDAGEEAGLSTNEEGMEEEVCGMFSVIHFFNCLSRHPAAFKPLEKLLSENVWKTLHAGIHPLDLLRCKKSTAVESIEDKNGGDTRDALQSCNMKALLWVFEQIQTVPTALSVQLMIDGLSRLENDSKALVKQKNLSRSRSTVDFEAAVCFPCLFIVLAKVQHAVSSSPTSPLSSKSKKKKSKSSSQSINGAPSDDSAEKGFVLENYVFWREEDELLFGFRDKRVAVLVYRCRPQYEGQPEIDIPLSLMFAVQNGGAHQAAEELKKRAAEPTKIIRFQ